jgi:DNA-binding NtrC family response regulator
MQHILIMDPSLAESSRLRAFLEKSGHRVTETNHYENGYKIIQSGVIDLIMFDFTLPGVDGFQFLRKIPENLRKRSIVLAPKSSLAPLGLVEQLARCNGAMGVLKKPVKNDPLLKLVENNLVEGAIQ